MFPNLYKTFRFRLLLLRALLRQWPPQPHRLLQQCQRNYKQLLLILLGKRNSLKL